jgi:hypothetical protein
VRVPKGFRVALVAAAALAAMATAAAPAFARAASPAAPPGATHAVFVQTPIGSVTVPGAVGGEGIVAS